MSRITNNILTNDFMANYNRNLTRLSDLQKQMSSGREIDKPSDDPVRKVRSLQFYTSASVNEMYTQNANDAVSWMSTSDGAVSSVVDALTEIKTLINSAIKPAPNTSNQAIAEKVDKLVDEMVNLGNTQVGDRYIFAGQKDDVQPFTRDSTTGVVTYSGTWDGQGGVADAGTICMKVSPGAVDTIRDKINLDGQQLFGTVDAAGVPLIFQQLNDIVAHIKNGDATVLTNDLQTIDDQLDNVVLPAQTTLGSRQSVYETTQARLKSDSITIETDRSNNEDINEAKASIDFSVATNVYNATLSVGAKLLPNSLVDYLK